MDIIKLQEKNNLFDKAIQVFWQEWGNEHNYKFYEDAIKHSCNKPTELPSFYVAVDEGDIIGTYALLRNDLNSRQDLCPWLACLYVSEKYRGKGIGSKLLQHGLCEAAKMGHDKLYLSTNFEGYYEQYGWIHSGIVYDSNGRFNKLYEKHTNT